MVVARLATSGARFRALAHRPNVVCRVPDGAVASTIRYTPGALARRPAEASVIRHHPRYACIRISGHL
jgi:hypothetical protein